jgi:hypothetical protein
MEPLKLETDQCAGNVRFAKTGQLQQLFIVIEYDGATPSRRREEWRDVPIDTSNDAPEVQDKQDH